MLNIVGDSHVNTFAGYEHTRIWEIHPELSIRNLRKFAKPILEALSKHPHEVWAFQVGERDVRNHFIVDSVINNVPIDETIDATFKSYISFLSRLTPVFDIYTMTTPPQGVFTEFSDEISSPREIRHVNAIKFNVRLKKGSIKCLDLWKMGAYPNDMITTEYFQEDGLHIKPALAETALRHALKTWENPQVSRK